VPIDLGELSAHLAGKILEPSDQERQCGPQRLLIEESPALLLQTGQTPAQASQARLELGLVDETFGIAVNQPADPAVQLGDLAIEQGRIGPRGIALAELDEPSLVLGGQTAGIAEQVLDLPPDRRVKPVGAHLRVGAQALPAEPISIRPAAPVVGVITPPALAGSQADRLAVVGVAALLADDQTLQQETLAARALPAAPAVLLQLRLHGLEHFAIDHRRNRYRDPFIRGNIVDPHRAARLLGTAADWPQPGRQGTDPCLAERRGALVGGVFEQAPHGGPIPALLARRGSMAGPPQPTADLADAESLHADPVEDLAHHLGLIVDDLVAGLATPDMPIKIAVAVGSAGQHIDAARAGRVFLAAPAALQDLGPLVLGDHALNLKQQVVFG